MLPVELMRNHHIKLEILCSEYVLAHPDGYRYSRFGELYASWEKRLSVTTRQGQLGRRQALHRLRRKQGGGDKALCTIFSNIHLEDEALAIARKAKVDGFIGIKIYGSFNPARVKATAAEAHRLGLHVQGHLPAGMRPRDAIDDGYDETPHLFCRHASHV